ncbi:hypothetical protein ONZ51_g245 [Trametes cubensis]|uniref:Uncharacterized protein n=1 Tax=Trametes cubensis TaxID=1111947 RepID=A0AAD7XE63_9APHY|nr:hypothetical protein ONZ51_g245 [Trametes cubensis]
MFDVDKAKQLSETPTIPQDVPGSTSHSNPTHSNPADPGSSVSATTAPGSGNSPSSTPGATGPTIPTATPSTSSTVDPPFSTSHAANPATDTQAEATGSSSSGNTESADSATSGSSRLGEDLTTSAITNPQDSVPSPTDLRGGHSSYPPDFPSGTSVSHATSSGVAGTSGSRIGPIIGAVFGVLVVIVLAVGFGFCLLRRRRRHRRQVELMRAASEPLDWWRRPGGIPTSLPIGGAEPSECSTVRGDDAESELETLHCDSMSIEKKSVTYGNYPDI